MTGMLRFLCDKASSAGPAIAGTARRLARGKAGIAAVEFALILPMLLALYFGCVILAQGLDVGRKTQLLSRTLADITSQQLPGQQITGNCSSYQTVPCLNDADFVGTSGSGGIFNSAAQVLFPFYTSTNTSMTISEIVFDNVGGSGSSATICCQARVVWSIGAGASPVLRSCSTGSAPPFSALTTSANGTNGAGVIPMGVYPGGTGDVLAYPPTPAATAGNTTNNYVIVTDVSFSYKPVFGFQFNQWGQAPNSGAGYVITQTTYMTPRNGATTPIVWANGGTITTAHDCTRPTLTSGTSNYGPPISASQPSFYNIP